VTDHLRVIIESPYAAPTPEELALHLDYARACLRDSLLRGEAPIASHLLYTQPGVLRDEVQEERAMGIAAGWAWREVADAWIFYLDLGWSGGMKAARELAEREGRPIVLRILGEWA
jgi:hypothetical protein